MTDPNMSRDQAEAILTVQNDMEPLWAMVKPTPSGRFRLEVTAFNTHEGTETREETRELIELLIRVARELEGLA